MLVSRVTAARCAEAKAVLIPLPGQNSTCRRHVMSEYVNFEFEKGKEPL